MFSKFYASIVLFIAFSQCAFAQNNEYKFTRLDITNGLSNNRINCIYKDAEGFMWFGTTSGLNRYDGYEFKVFKHDPTDPASLCSNYVNHLYEGPGNKIWVYTHYGKSVYDPATGKFDNDLTAQLLRYRVMTNDVTSIKKDADGNFWFITIRRGIYYYNSKTHTTSFYNTLPKSPIKLHSSYVADVVPGAANRLWIIYHDGFIDELDTRTNQILKRDDGLSRANNAKGQEYIGMMDKAQNLWIYVNEQPIGVYVYNTVTNILRHFEKGSPGISLNSNIINSIVQADNGIWIGTDHGGINQVDLAAGTVNYILNRPDDERSIPGNSATLYRDNTGIIWNGSFKQGISYYHKGVIQFPLVRHYEGDNNSLPNDDVDSFVEDAGGNLWIGTNGGGLEFFDTKTKRYTQYQHDPNNPNSLANDIVISLCMDHAHNLWIGTYFGGLDRFDGKTFTHYRHNDNVPGSLSDDRVYTIMEDAAHNIWVGTFAGPINIYDPKTNTFTHPAYHMQSEYTAVLYQDKQQNIWIGRDNDIDVIDHKTNTVKHYYNNPGNRNSLVANDVNSIMQDHKGLMWIGTKEGLSIFNPKTNKFINIEEKQGLPSNNIWNVLEDNSGRVWMSTGNGLASVKLTQNGDAYSYQIHSYNEADGLQGREFNAYAALKMRDGRLIFGGAHGFNIFDPAAIKTSGIKPQLVFTDLQLFNKSVNVGDTVAGKVVLTRSITEAKSIELNHGENDFTISFAACDYFNPGKTTYQYMLEGFDKGWLISPANSRKATYTNLDAGNYVFKVRAINPNDPGNVSTIALDIKILPPFWKTAWAYLLYLAVGVGILFYIRHRGIVKLKREFEVTQDKLEAERRMQSEREEAGRMHELDLMKIKFFTNVSHEFRTPLSLIISPIEALLKNTDQPEQKNQLVMIKRNGRRLLNLVNQLLDFRKMEFKELKLSLRKGEIVEFIREVAYSFNDLAQQHHIDYLFESEVISLHTKFDHDKIERILFNLLSNAFKFTPSGGNISVFLSMAGKDKSNGETQLLEIKVVDTGIGISEEKQEKIFDRFFQVDMPESVLNQGSGIGLSITHEFVKMHNGEISVESEPGNGSTFIVRLPLNVEEETYIPAEPLSKAANSTLKHGHILDAGKKPVVLIIEDNDDLRFYLKDNLKHIFNIIEAVNGKDGWQKALSLHPNLIVSDVTMPEMSGIELCKKIREDSRTAHIPVILLTALNEDEDQLAGLANGANDYITKPFNFEILLSKINGLLLMQQTLKKTYQKQKEIQVQDIEIVSEDEKFLKATFDCIEKNITNYNFSVEELSRQMALSRVSLYKRMLALTGKTPVDCIRTVRLKRAVQLLEKSQLSIANIAYEVGFNNPTYFSKVFKDEYGTVPSDYVLAYRKKELEEANHL
jgi:signal transduction histidine kinase/ligand-binding sensor domain-containing protein/DNA-binding response OmpR family regulator